MNIFRTDFDSERYFVVTYFLKSSIHLASAAWQLAVGQSIGNPNVRSVWETEEMFENHSCLILGNEEELRQEREGIVKIAFPLANINLHEDGVSQLLCQIMGGQLDIDSIEACHVKDIEFPEGALKVFRGPKFGIQGIREFTKTHDKPLLGGIIKPKVGFTPDVLLGMVKELVEGGANFIKEDEIMANPSICPMQVRVPLVMDYLREKNVIYAVCINGDMPYLLDRVRLVHALGGNAIHVNFWSGLGAYKAIRDLDLPLFLHFQKSGDRILTDPTHRFHIDWKVVCDLAGLMGVDFIHAGMFGGYLNATEEELRELLLVLHKHGVMPALSCGMHPGLVQGLVRRFGNDFMANTGGAIHGHPMGTKSGAIAMRQAIDGDHGEEYKVAVEKWGMLD
jgi:ribulose-bisphosphate carboxylase large chain